MVIFVFRQILIHLNSKIEKYNLKAEVDSAGFEPYHVNDKPDYRACEVMQNHGINITKQRARLFKTADFDEFDRIYVMDSGNYRDVMLTARNGSPSKNLR